MASEPCSKRRCLGKDLAGVMNGENSTSLTTLLELGEWETAMQVARSSPEKVGASLDPSPLAVACRSGAPYECVRAVLEAAPENLRRVLDSRGTPLHEAIVCENTGTQVIAMLLEADEKLGSESTRATLLQDVDGFTPLHLLIRRRFQTHILRSGTDTGLMQILEMLVRSCPDAVTIPDRGEYEEPPIVYAVKANIYAPSLGSEDTTLARVERQIFEMVDCRLRHCPSAASRVFSGYRGQYTALHSAVFHGRYTGTIELILRAEGSQSSDPKAALLQNTQGEIPLHFCAMRGERPRTVALIADEAPDAVLKRDTSGLTPFHWLWIRFVSTLLTLEDGGRGTDNTILIDPNRPTPIKTTKYNEFSVLEQGDFDVDLQLIKRMDPAVDFLRMRHIPVEVIGDEDCLRRAGRAAGILKRIRERYYEHAQATGDDIVEWTREEAVIALFWTKVVSLLQASNKASPEPLGGDSILVHTAFASKCCPPAVAHMVALLYEGELMTRDNRGQLPLHCAASRPWHRWDWPGEDSHNEPTASQLLHGDSLGVLRVALALTPQRAVQITDNQNRLVLHHLIDTLVTGASRMTKSMQENSLELMLDALRKVVKLYPESLQRIDGLSMLYPFLQATATASSQMPLEYDELPLSVTYELLRENPTLLETTRTS